MYQIFGESVIANYFDTKLAIKFQTRNFKYFPTDENVSHYMNFRQIDKKWSKNTKDLGQL